MLPNPALDEFRALINKSTKGKDALEIARGEFMKNMVQRGRLHEKWLQTTSCLLLDFAALGRTSTQCTLHSSH